MLDGKKTYITGAIILAAAILGRYLGVIDGQTTAMLISTALLAMGIRNGIPEKY